MTTTTDGLLAAYGSVSDNSRLKVIVYVLERTDRKTYIFNGSFDDIAHGANVSYSAAVKTMQICESEGLVKKLGRCCWHIEEPVFENTENETEFLLIRNYTNKKEAAGL